MGERRQLYVSPGAPGKRGFEDLDCYKLALEVMVDVHAIARNFPPEEKYELTSQIRRSSKSVTANIAEGYRRYHYLDSLRCYAIARGELNETLAHLINARALGYVDRENFEPLYKLIREAEQALNGFMSYIRHQRAGSQEFGDKAMHEEPADYVFEQPE